MAKGGPKDPAARNRDKKPERREPSPPAEPCTSEPASPLPLPAAESKPAASRTSGETPSELPNAPEAQQAPPQTSVPTPTVKNTTFAYELPPSIATLEEVGQYALNASISSGRFEDLRVLAFSRRIPPDRVGEPRALYANSKLITRALPGLFKDERLDEVSDAGLAFCEGISVSSAYYGYSDDSDVEEDQGEEPGEDEWQSAPVYDQEKHPFERSPPSKNVPIPPQPTQAAHAADEETPPSSNVVIPPEVGIPFPLVKKLTNVLARSPEVLRVPHWARREPTVLPPTSATATTEPGSKHDPETTQEQPTLNSSANDAHAGETLFIRPGSEGLRTIFAADTAYRTWRAVVFYAYTRRIVFAPLRSQGLPFVSTDDEDDPAQLPICSPKSMYRLAAKYGNAELEQLAGNDIASKLSTLNALPELFSHFTSRYPQVQDMELNFVVAHLTHPDIAAQLPTWIDRFARGELKECANTFGRLIHKLACAATVTVGPAGVNGCPRGCAMSPIQHRCTMCGLTFN